MGQIYEYILENKLRLTLINLNLTIKCLKFN